MRKTGSLLLLLLWLFPLPSRAGEEIIPPARPVPDYVEYLLQVASEEVGYREDHGRSKYGAWAGDPAAQWCAEFLCWCVDQVDQRWGTSLLRHVYPYYTASNTGRDWFIRAGRYVVRSGKVDGWGDQWLKGMKTVIRSGDYIPQPGDWVFFTWTPSPDTDHVALVEYCTRDTETGEVLIHVIEGNKPVAVARDTYAVNDRRILGYGAVYDVADLTMRWGNRGEKVRQLQEKLAYLGYLDPARADGVFGDATAGAVSAFRESHGLAPSPVADREMQLLLDPEYEQKYSSDPDLWTVTDED